MNAKRGRPCIENRKDKLYRLRMNDEELAQLEFLAKETGKTKSDVIRDLIQQESHRLYYGYSTK